MIPSVRKRQYRLSGGFTLVEMLTVVTIAAIMMVIAVPNITSMVRNASMTNARNLVKTALSQAQSYAVRNGVHAGIRFQKAANGKTYLVLIENAKSYDWCDINLIVPARVKVKGSYANRYVAIPNAKPKALPNGVAAVAFTDRFMLLDSDAKNAYLADIVSCSGPIKNDGGSLENYQTFSVIFAPSGQLVTKYVQVQPRRNEYGEVVDRNSGYWVDSVFGPYQLSVQRPDITLLSYDNFTDHYDVFYSNAMDTYKGIYPSGFGTRCVGNTGMFSFLSSYQNLPAPWCMFNQTEDFDGYYLLNEPSATSLFLYMEDELQAADETGTQRYTNFFSQSSYSWGVDGLGNEVVTGVNKREGCEHLLINRYTGELIEIQ